MQLVCSGADDCNLRPAACSALCGRPAVFPAGSSFGRAETLSDTALEFSDVLNRADDFTSSQTDKAAMIAKLRRWLHVALTSQTNNYDLFTIEMRDDDPNAAQAAANWVLHGTVSKLKAEAKAGGVLATLRSNANVDDVSQKEENLETEKRKLEETYSLPFPDDVQERYEQIEAELNKLESEHTEAGLGFLMNLGGAFLNDSIKVVEETHVEKRSAGYGLGVLFAAVCLGCLAGVAGLLIRRVAVAVTEPKAATSGVPPVLPVKPPVIGVPPIISQRHDSKPPPLPPILPPAAHR